MIEKFKNDNNNVDINYNTFIENKLSGSNLLDRLLLTKTPNGELLTDDIINEEIRLILFSVSAVTFFLIYFIFLMMTSHT